MCEKGSSFTSLLLTLVGIWGEKKSNTHAHCQAQLSKEKYAENQSQKFPVINCWQLSLVKFYGGEKKKKEGVGEKGWESVPEKFLEEPCNHKGLLHTAFLGSALASLFPFSSLSNVLDARSSSTDSPWSISTRPWSRGPLTPGLSGPYCCIRGDRIWKKLRSAQTLALKLTVHSSEKDAIWWLEEQCVRHPL